MGNNILYLNAVMELYEFIRNNFTTLCLDKIKSELALQFLVNTEYDEYIYNQIVENLPAIAKFKNGIEIIKFILNHRLFYSESNQI